MEIEEIFVAQSLNWKYCRFATHIEDAKQYAKKLAIEYGGAEIYKMSYIKESVETIYHVIPDVLFQEPIKGRGMLYLTNPGEGV